MTGVLGRWGDNSELPLVFNLIHTLWAHAQNVAGGLKVYLNVRSYPALLIFTAYGLGLTRAERWSALHKLFSATIETRNDQTVRTIESLFLGAWKGTEENAWKQLEGLDNKRTPLSESLLALFAEWAKTFAGLAPDFEIMFERFELLGSLAFLEAHDKDSIKSHLAGQPHQAFAWTPVGRVGWHGSNADRLLAEIQAEPLKDRASQSRIRAWRPGVPGAVDPGFQTHRRTNAMVNRSAQRTCHRGRSTLNPTISSVPNS
jgi:hypothetical protein